MKAKLTARISNITIEGAHSQKGCYFHGGMAALATDRIHSFLHNARDFRLQLPTFATSKCLAGRPLFRKISPFCGIPALKRHLGLAKILSALEGHPKARKKAKIENPETSTAALGGPIPEAKHICGSASRALNGLGHALFGCANFGGRFLQHAWRRRHILGGFLFQNA